MAAAVLPASLAEAVRTGDVVAAQRWFGRHSAGEQGAELKIDTDRSRRRSDAQLLDPAPPAPCPDVEASLLQLAGFAAAAVLRVTCRRWAAAAERHFSAQFAWMGNVTHRQLPVNTHGASGDYAIICDLQCDRLLLRFFPFMSEQPAVATINYYTGLAGPVQLLGEPFEDSLGYLLVAQQRSCIVDFVKEDELRITSVLLEPSLTQVIDMKPLGYRILQPDPDVDASCHGREFRSFVCSNSNSVAVRVAPVEFRDVSVCDEHFLIANLQSGQRQISILQNFPAMFSRLMLTDKYLVVWQAAVKGDGSRLVNADALYLGERQEHLASDAFEDFDVDEGGTAWLSAWPVLDESAPESPVSPMGTWRGAPVDNSGCILTTRDVVAIATHDFCLIMIDLGIVQRRAVRLRSVAACDLDRAALSDHVLSAVLCWKRVDTFAGVAVWDRDSGAMLHLLTAERLSTMLPGGCSLHSMEPPYWVNTVMECCGNREVRSALRTCCKRTLLCGHCCRCCAGISLMRYRPPFLMNRYPQYRKVQHKLWARLVMHPSVPDIVLVLHSGFRCSWTLALHFGREP